jgi:hypothetical protein
LGADSEVSRPGASARNDVFCNDINVIGLTIFNGRARKIFWKALKGSRRTPKFAPTAPDYGAENGRTVQSKLKSMV